MAKPGKALVPKRDPLSSRGGKVPIGEIPAGARPASGVRSARSSPEDVPQLDDLVSENRGFYDWSGVRALLHVTDAELQAAITTSTVLCVRDAAGASVFPAWQFINGEVLPFLSAILHALARGISDPWTWALWLTAPFGDDDDGPTSVDLLALGSDPRPILEEARRDAARWAH